MDERIAQIDPPQFWAKVDVGAADECWIWLSSRSQDDYGYLTVRILGRPRRVQAHRAAYELVVGPIPEGLTIDHLCRTRPCCNPSHMEPVTRGENARRGVRARPYGSPGTAGFPLGSRVAFIGGVCSNGHHLTEANTRPSKAKPHLLLCRDCERERKARSRDRASAAGLPRS